MALDKETIGWIAEMSGLSAEDVTAKITSEKEEGIKKPQGEFFTDEDLSKRDSSKYNEGKAAQIEMLAKDLKKKYGYEFEGKDIDSFMSHHDLELKKKYSKDSNARVEELEKDLKTQKETFEREIEVLSSEKAQLESKSMIQALDNKLLFNSPKDLTMSPQRTIALFKLENEPVQVEGVWTAKGPDGQPMKNPKTGEVIPIETIFSEFVIKEGFAKGQSGRGGGNEFGNKKYTAKTPEEFQVEWQKMNPEKNVMSSDYQKDYAEFRKEVTA